MRKPQTEVPVFFANGRRDRNYSLAAILRLLALGVVVVARSRKGRITCAQFKSDCGAHPLVKSAHLGQHYSYLQLLPGGYRAWRHRELAQHQQVEMLFGRKPESLKEVDLFVRAVFRAVPLSCMRGAELPPEPPAKPAKVVPIRRTRAIASEERRAA